MADPDRKDPVIGYPDKRDTGDKARDALFNWVVKRYVMHNHPWRKSDERVWGGFIYGVTAYLGYVLFFAFFGWILYTVDKLYGFERAVLLAMLFILFRINIMIKLLNRRYQNG